MYILKGNQDVEEYEEVPLVDALNGYLPADAGSGENFKLNSAFSYMSSFVILVSLTAGRFLESYSNWNLIGKELLTWNHT